MSPHIVELNDAGVRVARGVDELVRSPGYAVLVGGKVEVGEVAKAQAWIHPRHAHNRFWHDLDTTGLRQFGKRVRHAGDLAYLHLGHVLERGGQPKSAIFVVPGIYQRAQLSLLLGIAQAAGVTVTALVDGAVAACAILAPGRYSHVQALLHQCVITHIEVDGERVVRRQVESVPGAGLVHFERRLVGAIVEAFLARCRFDPLHQAATEQTLHNRLPEWLAALSGRPEIPIALEHRGIRHETRIHRDALTAAAGPLVALVRQRLGQAIAVLDFRLAEVPGVSAGLGHAHVLAPDALFKGCAANPGLQTATGGVTLTTELRAAAAEARLPAAAAPIQASVAAPVASHILVQHHAFPLGHTPVYVAARGAVERKPAPDSAFSLVQDGLGVRLDVVNGAAVILNGSAVVGSARVQPGDHITMPGAATLFLPIKVQADDAL